MSRLLLALACLAVTLATAAAEPRYAKLQTRLACSLDQVFMCEGEIEGESTNYTKRSKILLSPSKETSYFHVEHPSQQSSILS